MVRLQLALDAPCSIQQSAKSVVQCRAGLEQQQGLHHPVGMIAMGGMNPGLSALTDSISLLASAGCLALSCMKQRTNPLLSRPTIEPMPRVPQSVVHSVDRNGLARPAEQILQVDHRPGRGHDLEPPWLNQHELDPVAGRELKGLPHIGGDGDLTLPGHDGGTHGLEFRLP
jgi:hypothetical protein